MVRRRRLGPPEEPQAGLSFTVDVALIGWPLAALAFCALLHPRRAVVTAYVAAWLFLPVYRYLLPGMPDWNKTSATSVSLLLGLLIFDFQRIIAFRPRWFDLPMAVWCLCPAASSLANGLGLYDGVANVLEQTVIWGIPYFLGRLYFSDVVGLRDLALGVFFGGLVYIPFCLFEIRMSPQLHNLVYGYHQQELLHSYRFGGWRPAVFMWHGLMVGMWMSMASLVGTWLWISGTVRSIRGIALPWFLVPLGVTTLLCKSAGALVLLAAGLFVLLIVRRFHVRWPIILLGLVAPLYILTRVSGLWSGEGIVEAAKSVSPERAGSFATRLMQEDMLSAKAMKRPVFGWGGWGRSRVTDEFGTDISITDGQWIIEFGTHGFVGLAGMLTVLLVPLVVLARRLPAGDWTRPLAAPLAALATVLGLYVIDLIPNAMITPIYTLAAGGMTGLMAFRTGVQESTDGKVNDTVEPTGS